MGAEARGNKKYSPTPSPRGSSKVMVPKFTKLRDTNTKTISGVLSNTKTGVSRDNPMAPAFNGDKTFCCDNTGLIIKYRFDGTNQWKNRLGHYCHEPTDDEWFIHDVEGHHAWIQFRQDEIARGAVNKDSESVGSCKASSHCPGYETKCQGGSVRSTGSAPHAGSEDERKAPSSKGSETVLTGSRHFEEDRSSTDSRRLRRGISLPPVVDEDASSRCDSVRSSRPGSRNGSGTPVRSCSVDGGKRKPPSGPCFDLTAGDVLLCSEENVKRRLVAYSEGPKVAAGRRSFTQEMHTITESHRTAVNLREELAEVERTASKRNRELSIESESEKWKNSVRDEEHYSQQMALVTLGHRLGDEANTVAREISQRDGTIDLLRSELEFTKTTVAQLESQSRETAERASERIGDLELRLTIAEQNAVSEFEAATEMPEMRRIMLEEIDAANTAIADLTNKNADRQKRLEYENSTLNENVLRLQKLASMHRESLRRPERQEKDANQRMIAASEKSKSLISAMEADYAQLATDKAAAEDQLAIVESHYDDLRLKIETDKEEIDILKQKNSRYSQSLLASQRQSDSLLKKVEKLTSELASRDDNEYVLLEDRFNQECSLARDFKVQYDNCTSEVGELERALKDFKKVEGTDKRETTHVQSAATSSKDHPPPAHAVPSVKEKTLPTPDTETNFGSWNVVSPQTAEPEESPLPPSGENETQSEEDERRLLEIDWLMKAKDQFPEGEAPDELIDELRKRLKEHYGCKKRPPAENAASNDRNSGDQAREQNRDSDERRSDRDRSESRERDRGRRDDSRERDRDRRRGDFSGQGRRLDGDDDRDRDRDHGRDRDRDQRDRDRRDRDRDADRRSVTSSQSGSSRYTRRAEKAMGSILQRSESGSKVIHVDNMPLFRKNMVIDIFPKSRPGAIMRRTIVGFGSLHLDQPLDHAVETGDLVEEADVRSNHRLFRTSTINEEDGSDFGRSRRGRDRDDGSDNGRSRRGTGTARSRSDGSNDTEYPTKMQDFKNADRIKDILPKAPRNSGEIMVFHRKFCDVVLMFWPYPDNVVVEYYDEILTLKTKSGKYEGDILDRDVRRFRHLERAIKSYIEAHFSKNHDLSVEIEQYRKVLYQQNKSLTTRRMVAMSYSFVGTEDSVVKVNYVLQLHNLEWKGDDLVKVTQFYYKALDLCNKIEYGIDVDGKKNAIYSRMRMDTKIFKDRLIRDFEPLPEDKKNAETLLKIMKDHIDEERSLDNYQKQCYKPDQAPKKKKGGDDQNPDANALGLGKDGGGKKGGGKKGGGGKSGGGGKPPGGTNPEVPPVPNPHPEKRPWTGPKNQNPDSYNVKRLCLPYQKAFGEKGCNKGAKCKYLHLVAKDKKDFDAIPRGPQGNGGSNPGTRTPSLESKRSQRSSSRDSNGNPKPGKTPTNSANAGTRKALALAHPDWVCTKGKECGGYKNQSCPFKHYGPQKNGAFVPDGRTAAPLQMKKKREKSPAISSDASSNGR